MKAVIMAGGEGTRLRPLTSTSPKPMLPVANRPMMEHVIDLLKKHGFDEIVVTVAYMANAIRNYFGDGSEFGVTIHYADEPTPLGTAGSVRNAMEHLDERFLVISGDVITDVDVSSLVKFHDEQRAIATIGLVRVDNPLEFGIVITKEDGSIDRFLEKPTWGQVFSDTINTGIYVLEPAIFDDIEADRSVDFSSDVFPKLLDDAKPMFGYVLTGYWEDVGTLEAYLRAHKDVLDERVELAVPGFKLNDGVWLGDGAEVSPNATLTGPAVIGDGCKIEDGVRIGEYVVLGRNTRVRAGADIDRSILFENNYVGPSARLRGAIAGRACNVRTSARCEEGVVLGDEVYVGRDASLANGVKVYPFKTIEDAAVVNSSIVWESRGARSLFGRKGVTGLANVDITPELATKVAMALGTSLKKGVTVVTSRDSSRSARMLKRAMMSGLNASGVNVIDLEVASTPVTRFVTRSPVAFAGLTLRLEHDDPNSVTIRFFDTSGADIPEESQRKIERLFQREDYRHVLPEEIGDINFPPRALEDYTQALEETVKPSVIAAHRFKLVVDYGYGAASFVMPNVLSRLRADVLAVNPYASTLGVISFDQAAAAENIGRLVLASGAHLGAVLDPDGERLTIVDDAGAVLTDTEALLAFIDLVADYLLGDQIALPVNQTMHAQRIASAKGRQIRWSKTSAPALMDVATEPGVGFAADGRGGFILPGFMPAFDAAAALVKLLDLLARTGRRLSEVREQLPRVHLVSDTVVTPWDQKGTVMRSLVEHANRELVLVDGVKILHEGGWVLALPDPEEPVTRVYAEAGSDSEARRLASEYIRRIRQMVR